MAVMGRSGRSGRLRARPMRVGVAALACVSALTLAACDIRLETPPVTFPSPDATTVARNTLADAEAAVLAAARDAGASAEETASGAAATAQKHLDVLGGVYVAYPGTTPSPSPSAAPPPTLAEAIDAVRSTAEKVAATTDDADLAFLARSIDLDWALRELWAARLEAKPATGGDAGGGASAPASAEATARPTLGPSATDAPTPSPLPGDSGDAPFPFASGASASAVFSPDAATTGLTAKQLSALTVAEDEARFTYETIAALEFGALRQDILARMRLHAGRSDALAAVLTSMPDPAGGTAADPRTPLYQLRDVNLPSPDSREALERSVEIDLGDRYAALLDGASAADAAWLINAAYDSYARAMATPGFATDDVPTLPGLKVGTASASPKPSAASAEPTAG